MAITIEKSTTNFLSRLSKNNNREWFNKHKEQYLTAYENTIAFADALLTEIQEKRISL